MEAPVISAFMILASVYLWPGFISVAQRNVPGSKWSDHWWSDHWVICNPLINRLRLGGGFNHSLFSPLPGEMIQFDEHIFQMGWLNHQLVGSITWGPTPWKIPSKEPLIISLFSKWVIFWKPSDQGPMGLNITMVHHHLGEDWNGSFSNHPFQANLSIPWTISMGKKPTRPFQVWTP